MVALKEPTMGRFSIAVDLDFLVDCRGRRLVRRDPDQIISEAE